MTSPQIPHSIWHVGAVVALKSHPYSSENDADLILISGDPQFVPPLMIITETLKEGRSLYDENTGMKLSDKTHFQCKCLWFSPKTHQLEDSWISSRLLKVIKPIDNHPFELENSGFKYGASVCLKTSRLELKKRKENIKLNGASQRGYDKTITTHLSFVSPVMQIVGTTQSDSKEPLIDPKTGEKKREISRLLIKCKFYNPASDKLSEFLIPAEALELVPAIESEKINFLQTTIEDKAYLKVSFSDRETIIKPERINFRSGFYYLDAIDFLENKSIEIPLFDNSISFQHSLLYKKELPFFDPENNTLNISIIDHANVEKLNTSNYWLITYRNPYGVITERTVCNQELMEGEEPNANGDLKQHYYLKAHCMLRNAIRYFRLDRIQKIYVLDIIHNTHPPIVNHHNGAKIEKTD